MSDVNLGHERASEKARSLAAQSTGTKTANSWARRKELKRAPSKAWGSARMKEKVWARTMERTMAKK